MTAGHGLFGAGPFALGLLGSPRTSKANSTLELAHAGSKSQLLNFQEFGKPVVEHGHD